MFFQFDQAVTASKMIKSLQFCIDGKNKVFCEAREATKAEILSDSVVTQLTAEAGESKWIVAVPLKELTKGTTYIAKITVLVPIYAIYPPYIE